MTDKALAARLREHASAIYGHWKDDLDRAADLIESMAQRVPLTDEQIYQAIDAARRSYRAHTTGIRGQMLTIYDDEDWHLVRAVEQAHGIRSEPQAKCGCRACLSPLENAATFVVCPKCGNKRCPKAADHRNVCTGSNEPGQAPRREGSEK